VEEVAEAEAAEEAEEEEVAFRGSRPGE